MICQLDHGWLSHKGMTMVPGSTPTLGWEKSSVALGNGKMKGKSARPHQGIRGKGKFVIVESQNRETSHL